MQKFKPTEPAEIILSVDMKNIRARLSTLLGKVEYAGTKVIIHRHGKQVAALVCMSDFNQVWDAEDEKLYGPRDPETGRRKGGAWVKMTGWKPAARVAANEEAKAPSRTGFGGWLKTRLHRRSDD